MSVTERDLFLAILAMDSYNRGNGAGINDGGTGDTNGLGDASDGSVRIGNATITYNLQDAGITDAAQAAGFYAVAYETQYGTVISCRGTDFAPAGDLARHTRTAALRPDLGAGRGQRLTAGGGKATTVLRGLWVNPSH